jgi:hypothetical protein
MGRMVAVEDIGDDRRKHKRVSVSFAVTYEIKGIIVPGWAVNACNHGMLVRSYLPLGTARQILQILEKKENNRLTVQFTHDKSYRVVAEIRHLHLDLSMDEALVGLFMPKIG